MSDAASFSEILARFNRKERNLLLRDALGDRETKLLLSEDYCKRIGEKLELAIMPEQAWWATDYHIDWLFGALAIDRGLETDL